MAVCITIRDINTNTTEGRGVYKFWVGNFLETI